MKILRNTLTSVLFFAIILAISCKPDGDTEVGGDDDLPGTSWTTTNDQVTPADGIFDKGDWSGFKITFASDNTFEIEGVPEGFEPLWPFMNGTFAYDEENEFLTFTSSDNSESFATYTTYDDPDLLIERSLVPDDGRTSGILDPWIFDMTKVDD